MPPRLKYFRKTGPKQAGSSDYCFYSPEHVRKALCESDASNQGSRPVSEESRLQKLIEWGEKCCSFEGNHWDELAIISKGTAEHQISVAYDPITREETHAVKKTLSGQYGFYSGLNSAGVLESQPASLSIWTALNIKISILAILRRSSEFFPKNPAWQ